MKHVDHVRRQVRGTGITDTYLSLCFNQVTRMYNVDYNTSFRTTGKRDEMVNLFGELQQDLCCYCMRKIQRGTPQATLEHIIPQSTDRTQDMLPYFNLGYGSLNGDTLIASREFNRLHNPDFPPRPHTVAYHNFALSCNGDFVPDGASICCNNRRGDAFVNPVYLNSDIETMIAYLPDGRIQPVSGSILFEDIVDLIRIVALNHDALKEIRWIWHELSSIPLNEIERIERNNERKQLLLKYLDGEPKKINKLAEKYMDKDRWNRLMSYSWFHRKT